MGSIQTVVFALQEEQYGISIMDVLEIQDYEQIRPVPRVPDYVEGIMNVRGNIYSIVNLRKRLGLGEFEEQQKSQIILLNLEVERVGVMVDSVMEIYTFEEEAIEEPTMKSAKLKTSPVIGVVKQGKQMIVLLDTYKLISDEELILDIERKKEA